ncbi:sugar phosphate isomerase/epimerase [Kiritimatiellota bacterium B12222]|nr:sugar phosphate isomerase/epimerase [Kiritimatiellota bacterium B12222]
MTPEITVQLYSVREDAAKDYETTIRAIADMGFGCVEPAGYPGSSVEAAAKLFKELGLRAPSAHIGLPIGDAKNEILDQAQLMGHQALITGCPPRFKEHYVSIDEVKKLAELYTEAAANAAEVGIQVGYHNHDWDLCEIDGVRGYKVFLENTPESVLWEADLFWVARAGLDPAAFIKEIGPRGKFLHFKDGRVKEEAVFVEKETEDGKIMVSDSIPFLPAGKGQVDLVAAAKVADQTEYVAVELDSYSGNMMQAIKESYDYLTQSGIAKGTK